MTCGVHATKSVKMSVKCSFQSRLTKKKKKLYLILIVHESGVVYVSVQETLSISGIFFVKFGLNMLNMLSR